MNEEASLDYCVEYFVQRGMPRSDAEDFSQVALCAYHSSQERNTLQQTCEFILQVLESLKKA